MLYLFTSSWWQSSWYSFVVVGNETWRICVCLGKKTWYVLFTLECVIIWEKELQYLYLSFNPPCTIFLAWIRVVSLLHGSVKHNFDPKCLFIILPKSVINLLLANQSVRLRISTTLSGSFLKFSYRVYESQNKILECLVKLEADGLS